MSYLDKKISISADIAKVRAAAEKIKSDPESVRELERDPKAYFSSIGIEINTDTAELIKERLAERGPTPTPAGIIHVDI